MTQTAYDYSINLLSKKDYSVFKLKRKLKQKDYDGLEISETVSKLIDLKYLRESEYRRNLIISLLGRSYENIYIIRKLAQEELTTEDTEINKYKIEIGYDTKSEANKLLEFKMKNIKVPQTSEEKFKIKSKLASFLSSKGFSYDDINEVINKKLNYEDTY